MADVRDPLHEVEEKFIKVLYVFYAVWFVRVMNAVSISASDVIGGYGCVRTRIIENRGAGSQERQKLERAV